MSVTTPSRRKGQDQREGVALLILIVTVMWVVEAINAVDSGLHLDNDGIYPRNVGHLWGILTSPFLHLNWSHLIGNTVPFVFMGLIIALRGAIRLAAVTMIVIIIGGLGTWLIAPSGTVTVGASGVVFGYATYLLTIGLFNRSLLEIGVGLVVGVVWGGALLASIVPHTGVSWQAHVCGAIAGVVAAYVMGQRQRQRSAAGGGAAPLGSPALPG
jgi:membrane associated rhomboid family serine protease